MGRGLERLEGEIAFFTSKFIIKRFITIPFQTYKSYKDLKGCSSLSSLRFRVISSVLANLMVSVHIYQSQYGLRPFDSLPLEFTHLNSVQLPSITILFISSGTYTYSYCLRKNALAYVLNRNYGIIIFTISTLIAGSLSTGGQ